ncbi:hypothetical protein G6F37_010901 [Rhizopus arrhizus]|nr:hypothetical protein G6F38_010946 [Rhizopus arrhizus]KAG1151887.1 hypothetical protein G6F37_010901 [Rhizopus arrhizus]
MLIPFFILSFFIHFILADGSNVLVINSPQPNQQISSKSDFRITYTIVGGQATNPPFAAYYFHSLSADFIWKDHTSGQSLSFTISSSLDSSPYPNGLQNKVYDTEWKVPNCHFFSRYPPSQYDYSILFTPSYLPVTNSSPATGPEQSSITVPITIQVNNNTFPKC